MVPLFPIPLPPFRWAIQSSGYVTSSELFTRDVGLSQIRAIKTLKEGNFVI